MEYYIQILYNYLQYFTNFYNTIYFHNTIQDCIYDLCIPKRNCGIHLNLYPYDLHLYLLFSYFNENKKHIPIYDSLIIIDTYFDYNILSNEFYKILLKINDNSTFINTIHDFKLFLSKYQHLFFPNSSSHFFISFDKKTSHKYLKYSKKKYKKKKWFLFVDLNIFNIHIYLFNKNFQYQFIHKIDKFPSENFILYNILYVIQSYRKKMNICLNCDNKTFQIFDFCCFKCKNDFISKLS